MAFSIQTNVNALIAQENLRVNGDFQSRTIQRLTSGYRINQSGDDAAGLAIANKFRSDVAELAQGVRNANDGVAQLQIMDGGIGNISKMLDRLKTLATQSASSTFTGNRSVLNKEYQTLVGEIDRQAQSIGLATNGRFATKMSVFIGGGSSNDGGADAANGSVQLDLTGSVVDSRGLSLRTDSFQVASATGTDISAGSLTSVSQIVTDGQNGATATFNFSGPNFASVGVSVNLTGVTDTDTLVSKVNDAIKLAGNAGSVSANSLRDADITASIVTDSTGAKRLAFSSTNEAFQVAAGTKNANALMGNFKTAGLPEGADVAAVVKGGANVTAAVPGATVNLRVIKTDGTEATIDTLLVAGDDTAAEKLTRVQTALAAANTGITATLDGGATGKLVFTAEAGKSFSIAATDDSANLLGLGAWAGGWAVANTSGGDISGVVGAGLKAVYSFSVNGGEAINVEVDASSIASAAASLDAAFSNNATLTAAGLDAVVNGNGVDLDSTTAVRFKRVSGTDLLLTGAAQTADAVSTAAYKGFSTNPIATAAGSASSTGLGATGDVFAFSALRNAGDKQELSVSLTDEAGERHAVTISLTNVNALNIDKAIEAINGVLQGDSDTENVVAVKQLNKAGTAEGIRFISADRSFTVNVGAAANYTSANPVGLYDGSAGASKVQGISVDSSQSGAVDISTMAGAAEAVTTIGSAISKLGSAQAAIGKGQNQLGYAVNLANSQISNYSAAESRIRDADVAAEAANLTKAQVLQQASIAAMAQANSAPQAVLSLLRG